MFSNKTKKLLSTVMTATMMISMMSQVCIPHVAYGKQQQLIGDISGDGKVDSIDMEYLEYMATLDLSKPENASWKSHMFKGDLNGDGKVNSRDVELLKKYLSKEISALPTTDQDCKDGKCDVKDKKEEKKKETKKKDNKKKDKKQANKEEKSKDNKLEDSKIEAKNKIEDKDKIDNCKDGKCNTPEKEENKTNNEKKETAKYEKDIYVSDIKFNGVDLSSFQGKKVLIQFFNSWDDKSIEQIKDLNKLQEELKNDNIVIVPIHPLTYDIRTADELRAFREKYNLNINLYMDNVRDTARDSFNIYESLGTVLLDENGKELRKETGRISYDRMKKFAKGEEDKKEEVKDYNEKINFTAKDVDGNKITLSDYKGKKVYLTYWNNLTDEGREHIQRLNKLYNTVKDKENIVFLTAVCGESDANWSRTVGYNIPVIIDNLIEIDKKDPCPWAVEIAKKLNVDNSLNPDSYLIDENGNIIKQSGKNMTIKEMKEFAGIKTEVDGERKDAYNANTNFTVKDKEGKTVSLSDYVGKKVFLTYWYPYKENFDNHMQNVNKIYKALGDRKDIQILTVTFDGFVEYTSYYTRERNLELPVLIDEFKGKESYWPFKNKETFEKYLTKDQVIANKFQNNDIDHPGSYLIDEDGKILKRSNSDMSLTELKDFMGLSDLKVDETPVKFDYNMNTTFTAKDINGNIVSLKDFAGKKVFVTYVYPYGSNVEEHLEKVNEIYNRLNRKDVVILTVTDPLQLEQRKENIEYFNKKLGLDFPVLLDTVGWYPHQSIQYFGNIARKLLVEDAFYPSSYLIDEKGNIINQHHDKSQGAMSLEQLMNFMTVSESDLKDKSSYKSDKAEEPKHLAGDSNFNGKLDEQDLRFVKYVADLKKNDPYTYDSYSLLIKDGDMNDDGVIDDVDVALMEKAMGKTEPKKEETTEAKKEETTKETTEAKKEATKEKKAKAKKTKATKKEKNTKKEANKNKCKDGKCEEKDNKDKCKDGKCEEKNNKDKNNKDKCKNGKCDTNTKKDIYNSEFNFTLNDLNNKKVSLSDYQGKKVMVTFWTTWCHYCKNELNDLNKLNKNLNDSNIAILAVNVGGSNEEVAEFMKSSGLDFSVLLDSNYSVKDKFQVSGYPSAFLIDENGKMIKSRSGSMDLSQMENFIR